MTEEQNTGFLELDSNWWLTVSFGLFGGVIGALFLVDGSLVGLLGCMFLGAFIGHEIASREL